MFNLIRILFCKKSRIKIVKKIPGSRKFCKMFRATNKFNQFKRKKLSLSSNIMEWAGLQTAAKLNVCTRMTIIMERKPL